jgi:hypothetical protein
LLRTSQNPLFVRLRALLPAYGIDVARDVLHHGTGDLTARAASGVLAEWTDLSTRWRASPYVHQVEGALDLLEPGRVPRSCRSGGARWNPSVEGRGSRGR